MSDQAKPRRKIFPFNDFTHLSIRDRVLSVEKEIIGDPDFVGFDKHAISSSSLELLDAQPNSTKWSMVISPELCNKSGNLHGGAAATLLDNLTSTALVTIAKPGFLDAGHVSRTITMTYVRPVPMGSKAIVECEVQAAGRNTANVVGKIFVDGKLCVSCVHDKAVFQSPKASKL